ncbi:MAG: glycosyltransferase [Candidatus Sumerlaeia bacterium]|nr:glycosyltransferase [Candidatus Sumerlaeia bacterium]
MSPEKPLISVIIPTYNRPLQLKRAVRSVLNQTYSNYEVIIIDDGSTLNIADVLNSFSDPRIKLIKHERKRGGAAARNSGLQIACGDFINFLDDDDEIAPDKFAKQLSRFDECPDATGVVYAGVCYALEENQKIFHQFIHHFTGNVFLPLLRDNFLVIQTPLIRRNYLEKAGFFDESLPGNQDWDLFLRLAQHCEFVPVPEILATIWVHGNQITADLHCKIVSYEKIKTKYLAELQQHPDILSYHLLRLGKLYFLAGERHKASQYFWQAIKTAPLNWKNYLHLGLSSILPEFYYNFIRRRQLKIGNITFY